MTDNNQLPELGTLLRKITETAELYSRISHSLISTGSELRASGPTDEAVEVLTLTLDRMSTATDRHMTQVNKALEALTEAK